MNAIWMPCLWSCALSVHLHAHNFTVAGKNLKANSCILECCKFWYGRQTSVVISRIFPISGYFWYIFHQHRVSSCPAFRTSSSVSWYSNLSPSTRTVLSLEFRETCTSFQKKISGWREDVAFGCLWIPLPLCLCDLCAFDLWLFGRVATNSKYSLAEAATWAAQEGSRLDSHRSGRTAA